MQGHQLLISISAGLLRMLVDHAFGLWSIKSSPQHRTNKRMEEEDNGEKSVHQKSNVREHP
jgi:hypothetical protein